MRVTALEWLGSGKCRVYLNDAPAFRLSGKEIRELALAENFEADEEWLNKVRKEILIPRARKRCMYLLQSMDRTEWQLREKLREGEYPEDVIDDAIAYVEKYHYIDDSRYAENYVRTHREGRSRTKLRYELCGKGISGKLADSVLDEMCGHDETEMIRKMMQKKHFEPETALPEEKRRFAQSLLRKGFRMQDIYNAGLTKI